MVFVKCFSEFAMTQNKQKHQFIPLEKLEQEQLRMWTQHQYKESYSGTLKWTCGLETQ